MDAVWQKAVAIAPKFTAAASAVGSAVCCHLILRRLRGGSKKNRTYLRLILGMSMCDFTASAAWFLTTWPIPRGTPGVYGAVGNQQTCSAQAFFAQFSLSTVMYNGSLALYYVLIIVKGWSDHEIVRIEPFLHAHAIAWGLGTGLAGLGLTLFNQVGWDCWISAAPLGCQESWNSPDGTTTCVRGDNGSLYQWAFYYAPLWIVIALVSLMMSWVYHTVRRQEEAMRKYTPGGGRRARRNVSNYKRIRTQASCYVGAFFITWFFPTIFQLVLVSSNNLLLPLLFLTALFVPIQGLLNLVVFLRPTYIKYRRIHLDENEGALTAWFQMMYQEIVKGEDAASQTTTHRQTSNDLPPNAASKWSTVPTGRRREANAHAEDGGGREEDDDDDDDDEEWGGAGRSDEVPECSDSDFDAEEGALGRKADGGGVGGGDAVAEVRHGLSRSILVGTMLANHK